MQQTVIREAVTEWTVILDRQNGSHKHEEIMEY
jgi:hypothetical protein